MLTDVRSYANSRHDHAKETTIEGKNGFARVVEHAWMSPSRTSKPEAAAGTPSPVSRSNAKRSL
jgi:hypothetical protein